jgi:hypothetical protein
MMLEARPPPSRAAMRRYVTRRYDACAIKSRLWGRKKCGRGRKYVVVRATRRIFRGEFRGLEFAGFASLMSCGRHQTGVPTADFRAAAANRATATLKIDDGFRTTRP